MTDVQNQDRMTTRCLRLAKEEMKTFAIYVTSASPDRPFALMVFLVLVAVSITSITTRYFVLSEPEQVTNAPDAFLTTSLEVASIICLVLIICLARSQPTEADAADAYLQRWHRFLRRNIKLCGIIPFYTFILVFDIFRLNASLNCLDTQAACYSKVDYVEIWCPITRSIYLFIVLIFCVKFNAKHFVQNTLVLVGLAIVQATNLTLYVDTVLEETEVFTEKRNATVAPPSCMNGTTVNGSEHLDHFVQCIKHTTKEYQQFHAVSPYLYPFIIEYLMLVVECVADWFFTEAHVSESEGHDISFDSSPLSAGIGASPTVWQHPDTLGLRTADADNRPTPPVDQPNTSHETQSPTSEPGASGSQQSVPSVASYDRGGDTELLIVSASPVLPTSPTPRTARSSSNRDTWCHRCPWLFISVALTVFFTLLYVIFGVFNYAPKRNSDIYQNLYVWYRTAYWLALSLAPAIAYSQCRGFQSQRTNPAGFEYFVILTSVGAILQGMFTIVAYLNEHSSMFLIEALANIVHICLQIVFYFYAKNIQIPAATTEDDDVESKRSVFLAVISCFVVCNFGIWVENSFIETHNLANSWQKEYISSWPLIYTIYNPLTIVFRFNSVLLFLIVLFDKQRLQ